MFLIKFGKIEAIITLGIIFPHFVSSFPSRTTMKYVGTFDVVAQVFQAIFIFLLFVSLPECVH